MKASAFEYHAPESAAEAVALLADLGDEAKAIAGGQSLVPMLALRLAVFGHLVDIGRVAELRGIERRNGSLRIGAAMTQATIGRSAEVAADVPLLARATPLIGHFQIRTRGTIGGSIAHADAAAEYPAVALAGEATLEALSPLGARTIPAAEFFTGMWSTALAEDEILTAVSFPVRGPRSGFAVQEYARRRGDFALAGAAVSVSVGENGTVSRCAIGLFGLGPSALRSSAGEQAALAGAAPDEVGRAAVADLDGVPSDLHGSSGYRTHLGAAMVSRALTEALQEARS